MTKSFCQDGSSFTLDGRTASTEGDCFSAISSNGADASAAWKMVVGELATLRSKASIWFLWRLILVVLVGVWMDTIGPLTAVMTPVFSSNF